MALCPLATPMLLITYLEIGQNCTLYSNQSTNLSEAFEDSECSVPAC